MVHISELVKMYANRVVLDIQELSFEKNRLHLLTGHNGCGKSTLLKIIARLDERYQGTVSLGTESGNVVMCFQVPFLFCGTVWDNITYGLRARKRQISSDDIRDLAGRFGIGKLLHADAKKLSGGEARKVSLIRSLVLHPQLLLLDEPTSDIDPESSKKIEAEILSAVARGVTVIMATHHLHQARRMGGNVIRLADGMVADTAQIHNVFEVKADRTGGNYYVDGGGCFTFKIPHAVQEFSRVCITPAEIVLSAEPPITPWDYEFRGNVSEVRQTVGRCEIAVDVGIEIWCTCSPDSFYYEYFIPGKEVYLSFNKSAVRVL